MLETLSLNNKGRQNFSLAMIGSGGHARSVFALAKLVGLSPEVVISPDELSPLSPFASLRHIKEDEEITSFDPKFTELLNGVGHVSRASIRKKITGFYHSKGFKFLTLVSPTAFVCDGCVLSEGVQVFHGAIINAAVKIGAGTIVNNGVVVEHDCIIHDNVSISPNATLCGGVEVCSNVIIGPGATIGKNVVIGRDAIIGAGASIVRDVPPNATILPVKPVIFKGSD